MLMKSEVLVRINLFISQPMMICLLSAKKLRRDYAQFLIDYYELQEDPVQQRILESAKTFKNQHDMNQADSIRQAIKLRKDLFMDVWPNHNIETEKASEDQEDSTTS